MSKKGGGISCLGILAIGILLVVASSRETRVELNPFFFETKIGTKSLFVDIGVGTEAGINVIPNWCGQTGDMLICRQW
jgi:hypothetical protein